MDTGHADHRASQLADLQNNIGLLQAVAGCANVETAVARIEAGRKDGHDNVTPILPHQARTSLAGSTSPMSSPGAGPIDV